VIENLSLHSKELELG